MDVRRPYAREEVHRSVEQAHVDVAAAMLDVELMASRRGAAHGDVDGGVPQSQVLERDLVEPVGKEGTTQWENRYGA